MEKDTQDKRKKITTFVVNKLNKSFENLIDSKVIITEDGETKLIAKVNGIIWLNKSSGPELCVQLSSWNAASGAPDRFNLYIHDGVVIIELNGKPESTKGIDFFV